MIYYLMGKSATGKDTVYKRLKLIFPDMEEIVPYTTRPIRAGEQEGVEYHFIDDEEMDRFQREGRIIELREYHTVHGIWRYATVNDGSIQSVDERSYLMIGTLEGYEGMLRHFGRPSLTPIYIEVPTELRRERARERELQQEHPRLQEMDRRFLADERDFSEENIRKLGIARRFQNVNLEDCIREISEVIDENTKDTCP